MIYGVNTQDTYDPEILLQMEANEEPSQTVPDESFTIDQLIARHRAGLLTDVKTPIYTNEDSYGDEDAALDDPDFEKVGKMDLIDQANLQAESMATNAHKRVELKDDEEIDFQQGKVVKKKPKASNEPDDKGSK